jgi:hypothetical protein
MSAYGQKRTFAKVKNQAERNPPKQVSDADLLKPVTLFYAAFSQADSSASA